MGELFGSLYSFLFEEFYGINLSNYLWGEASPEQQTNMYFAISLSMLGISLFAMILYYYIIDHPKLSKWWGWLIFFGGNAVSNFIVGWQWVLKDLWNGIMIDNNNVALDIDEYNCLCFGVANMLLALFAFVIFSFMFKWWSKNCGNSPI